jgi:hypothetical protein
MAPETCEGVVASPTLDMWALGVLLQQYICGQLPYTYTEHAAFFRALLMEDPFIAPNLPPPFDAIIKGCLHKNPQDRWTASKVLSALKEPSLSLLADGASNSTNEEAPRLTRPAKIALWHGAQQRGSTGLEAAEGFTAFSAWEIPSVPDFSSSRFPDIAELDEAQRVQRVSAAQSQFLAALFPLGDQFGCSLRYYFERQAGGEGRIRLFLVGRFFAYSPQEAQNGIAAFDEIVERNFPPEYRKAKLLPGDAVWRNVVDLQNVQTISEALKPEQALEAWHQRDLCGFSFWYYPVAFAPAENDMVGVCGTLMRQTSAEQVCLDITLIPAYPMTAVERDEMVTWSTLAERWGREQRAKTGGGLYSSAQEVQIAPDPNAPEVKKAYGELLQRYGNLQNRCFLYAVRAFGYQTNNFSGSDATSMALQALAGHALQPGGNVSFYILDAVHPAFTRALNAARACSLTPAVCSDAIWKHPDAPETLRRLHRLVDIKEISSLFRFPIPGRDGCPGMALDSGLPDTAKLRRESTSDVTIGRFVEGIRVTNEDASFKLNDLNKHALIVGTPGSGKTTLCFSLLRQLWEEQRIPFVVLEPAKTEYRGLKEIAGLRDDLLVFTVGNERISPFRFNPFEIMEGVPVAEHIAALNTCFSGAFNLWDPLPMILDEAVRDIYAERGWSEYGVGGDEPGLEPPTFTDLYRRALQVAQSSSYKGETAGNIKGALETRLGALMRGPKGRCFNARRSIPFDLLMKRPVVLELESLNDDEKALMMMFLLVAVREYSKATRRSGSPLKHVVLVEEAHNVIGRGNNNAGEAKANPQEVAVRFFTRMLAEMRALGQGVIVADQLPTAIAPEAIKNTNIKVMHRLVAVDDRRELGGAMIFDDAQMEAAAIQPPGHSIVFMEGWTRSRPVQEPNFKEEYGVDEPQSDAELKEEMQQFEASDDVRHAYLPYSGCEASCRICDRRVREQSERWADRKKPAIEEMLRRDASASTVREYFDGLDFSQPEKVRMVCATVHWKQWFGEKPDESK